MAAKTGSLSINSENIFPIIKKWLYSDHDIFYRELISNGCDAITKLKKLALMGEYEEPGETEYKIQVTVNSEDKTITVEDNGIGIQAEDLPRVFEKGFTGYNGRADKKSTGIGLYLCKKIMDKMGHKIWIDSEVVKGTRVYLELTRQEWNPE